MIHRAELVVREQLAKSGETPYMLTRYVTCITIIDTVILIIHSNDAYIFDTYTPLIITSLADLTQKTEYYERAWDLSKGRFPRAKRTLGKLCYDRGDFKSGMCYCIKPNFTFFYYNTY
jgi:hypothetical protein